MAETKALHPTVLWAQNAELVYLTICVEDIEDEKFKLLPESLYFSCLSGPDKKKYEFTLELNKIIDPEKSQYKFLPGQRNITICLKKTDDSKGWWPRLTKDNKKVPWIKTDFDKWRDEDESDEEDPGMDRYQDMMNQMASFPKDDEDMPEVEEDSDDEDIPDLEG